jgi:Protein of unknown function (DUF2380)
MSGTIRTRAVLGMVILWSVGGVLADERAGPAATRPIKIAVFDFELEDKSAGTGIIALDERDLSFLKQSTEEAKRLLSETGRYDVVDTSTVAQHNLLSCDRCEGPLAQKLGAEQAMIGLVTRITRTEYTIQLRVIDAATKETASLDFTGLRIGANYSWPRGVRWLMKNRTLANLAE